MHSRLRSCFGRALTIALLFPLLISDSDAQIVIQTGDDLAAAVTSAPDGSFIEIQSNAAFMGTLAWQGKGLTIHAGVGFEPRIVGSAGAPAVSLTSASPDTVVVLIGLTLVPGTSGLFGKPDAMTLAGNGTIASWIRAAFLDCDFQGRVDSYGLGNTHFSGTFDDCKMEGFQLGGNGVFDATAVLQDCSIDGQLSLVNSESATFDVTVRRSRIADLWAACSDTSTGDLLVESSLLRGIFPDNAFGILLFGVDDAIQARFVNVTTTGYTFGIDAYSSATFENMLLYDNLIDLEAQVSSAQISNSLLSNGTFDGINGNFSGSPMMNATYAPLPGSIAFDSANSLAADLGLLDLNGDPRSQDGDGDLIASVNVGAIETKGASSIFYNGNGTNAPDYTLLTEPLLGKAFRSSVALTPTTIVTIVAVDFFSAPLSLPGIFLGETFIMYSAGLQLNFASGDGMHVINVPNDPAIAGATLMVQGARMIDVGGVGIVEALNGFNLVVGR